MSSASRLEVLVELRLRRGRELHARRHGPFGQIVAQDEQPVLLQILQQAVAARQQLVDQPGLFQIAQRLAPHVVHPAQHEIRVVEPPRRIGPRKTRQRNPCRSRLAAVQVRDDLHAVELVGRQLARDVEPPDRVDPRRRRNPDGRVCSPSRRRRRRCRRAANTGPVRRQSRRG